MKLKFTIALILLFTISFVLLFSVREDTLEDILKQTNKEEKKTSGAGKAIDMWSFERSYPYEQIPVEKYTAAFSNKKELEKYQSRAVDGEWENLGPKNIGGRTLCIAFHPTDENIMYAGSASGGLWKTTTQGVGEDAWEMVPTGFPVLGVAAIAIDPTNPEIIFIGTGETYGVGFAEPGTVNRLTRGTYGIGILKTEDGGVTWEQVLPFDRDDIKGVQDIELNTNNTQEIYAASTDGLYQSLDGGETWNLILNKPNCVDVEIDPNNEDYIYVTHGNLNFNLDPELSGIYKSKNKGVSFEELEDPNLITAWSGNAKLTIDPTNSNIIYASIQAWNTGGNTTPAGIFKSNNYGITWEHINNQNIAAWQGWYSHDIAINPANPSEIMYVGINAWKSVDSGIVFTEKTSNSWTWGEVPVDIPEGADDYVHSDIHAVYYHPINNKVFMATDGGVFVSNDGELPYTTLNGGLQTLQLYADMGSSATNPNYCIAGAQDNSTYIFKGSPSWWRVIGGDGMSAAVDQEDDQIVYGSAQGLNMFKSLNNGTTFFSVAPAASQTAFSAPYEMAPTNSSLLYAGSRQFHKSIDGADTWTLPSTNYVDGNNVILKIAISYQNPDIVLISTSPDPFTGNSTAKIFKTIDGGVTFTQLTNGLPDRICKDLEFDPTDDSVAYATFSGFGSDHVYKTVDGGENWSSIDNGLPDVPTNTILIDELNPDDIYVGNDLGVYYSENGGVSWEVFSDALPEAVMVYDLNHSPSNRKIRIATHGHGIYQRNYVNDFLSTDDIYLTKKNIELYPNPAASVVTLKIHGVENVDTMDVKILSLLGQEVEHKNYSVTDQVVNLNVSALQTGTYFVQCKILDKTITNRLIVQ